MTSPHHPIAPFSPIGPLPPSISDSKPQWSRQHSLSCAPLRLRYLLRPEPTVQAWLADHTMIDSDSHQTTTDPWQAIRFASVDVACSKARLILSLFPDLTVDPVELPWTTPPTTLK